MSTAATPRVTRRPAMPLIWVVPIVALLIAGWMIARQFRNHGPEITIEFANGAGIEAGKTDIEYKGVVVGLVTDLTLQSNLSAVLVKVRLTKSGVAVARAGSEFWVVHPEVSLTGVRGLETLVTGVRIRVRPGNGPTTKHFRGLDRPPPAEDPALGRAYLLRAEKLDGIKPGSSVYYRGVKVGLVETTRLAADSGAAVIRVRIFTAYAPLVRTNTQFWNAGGLDFHLGIHGVDLRADSLEALVGGGIAFATPDQPEIAPPALDRTEFQLHDKPEEAWLRWQPRIAIKPLESTPERSKEDGATESQLTLKSNSKG